jgi:hypothetical protein
MAMINKFSTPSIRGQADLFSLPATDTTVESSFYAEYKPIVNIQDSDAKIEFRIVGNSSQYLDLYDHFCYVRVKVINNDGTDLPAGAPISTANLFMHSLFSNCDVGINNQLVSSSNNCYMYKAFLETILTYGRDYMNSQGTCPLFFCDTDAGKLTTANTGFETRKQYIAESKPVEMIDKLKFDLSNQQRYILNDTTVNIALTRSPETFSILYDGKPFTAAASGSVPVTFQPKIKFMDASLFVRKHVLYPSIVLSHQRLLDSGHNARYPFRKSEVKFFSIPQSSQSFVEENVFLSNVPSRIIVCLVPSASFIGDYKLNPYVFPHNDLSYISLSVNNVPTPIKGVNLNFTTNEYLLPYYLLFSALGIAGQDQGLTFDRKKFAEQYAFFAFDISHNTSDSTLHLEKSGSVRLELKFQKGLTEALNCLIYSEQQKVLEIDKFRQMSIQ